MPSHPSSIFVFSRRIPTDSLTYNQFITVYAENRAQARQLVDERMRFVRQESPDKIAPYAAQPAFNVFEVPLDGPRIVTFHFSAQSGR